MRWRVAACGQDIRNGWASLPHSGDLWPTVGEFLEAGKVEHGRDVWQRLTQAAYANLDRELAAAWVAMLEPGARLRAVAGCGTGIRRGPLLRPRRRGGDAGRRHSRLWPAGSVGFRSCQPDQRGRCGRATVCSHTSPRWTAHR